MCAQMVMMIRLTEGLFDKSRMKRPDICSHEIDELRARSKHAGHTFGISYTNVARKSFIRQEYYRYAEHTLACAGISYNTPEIRYV